MNSNQLKLIASFVASPMFEAVKEIIQQRIEGIKNEPVKKNSQFETTYKLGEKEGGERELKGLIRTLEDYYQKHIEK